MKISINLIQADVVFLDEYAHRHEIPSRSAAVQHAVAVLRLSELESAYEEATDDWSGSEDEALWEPTAADDGAMVDATR